MTVQTGRTTKKFTNFTVGDPTTLRVIPVDTISVVGLVYDEMDLTAFQDAVKGALPAHPDAPIEIDGPFDTSAAVAVGAATMSGSHTILNGLAGATTPLSIDIAFGVRHAWEAGEPQFGISKSTVSGYGYICTSYTVNPNEGKYHAKFVLYPGSIAPAWGTQAEA